jgi:hypothetical protein
MHNFYNNPKKEKRKFIANVEDWATSPGRRFRSSHSHGVMKSLGLIADIRVVFVPLSQPCPRHLCLDLAVVSR